jgi:hypothetical protein
MIPTDGSTDRYVRGAHERITVERMLPDGVYVTIKRTQRWFEATSPP